MNRLIALAFLCPLALATPAAAQINFATPNGNVNADGHVIMCPKTGSSPVTYVPCDTTNPAAVTNTPTGTQAVNLTQILGAAPSLTNPLWVTPATGATFVLGAGSAIAGKVGIDQTTPGTTNAVSVSQIAGTTAATGNGVVGAGVQRVAIASDNTAFSINAVQSGTWTVQPGNTANTTPWLVTPTPSTAAGAATTSASSTVAASNLVLKGSAGNLYNLTATIGATSGYLLLFDATALPSNGAVTPVLCLPVTSNGTNGSISLDFSTPKRFGTGITAGFSTTGCFTLTASATANFFGGYQ